MSFVNQVRSKLPSPKASAFLATVATIFGLKAYDKNECIKIRARFQELARVKADEPMAVGTKPRRVEVYLVPPPGDGLYKPVEYFERWVKPIWDAAAMDYDLIKCKHAGQAHHRACEAVKWRRRFDQAQPLLSSTAMKDDKPGTPAVTPGPNGLPSDDALPHGFTLEELIRMAVKSAPASAFVAIGPLAFVEMVNGAAEGCTVMDTKEVKFISPEEEMKQRAKDVGLDEQELKLIEEEEALVKETTNDQTSMSSTSANNEEKEKEDTPTHGAPDLSALPVVDMIPYRNRIGWTTIPGRMIRWFYQRRLAAEIGAEALRIALEVERPLTALELANIENAAVEALEGKTNTLRAGNTGTSDGDAGLMVDTTIKDALRTFTMEH